MVMASHPAVLLVLSVPVADVERVLPGSLDPPSVGIDVDSYGWNGF